MAKVATVSHGVRAIDRPERRQFSRLVSLSFAPLQLSRLFEMPQTFKEMLDSKNDAELGAMCRDRFERLLEAHAMGLTDTHPAAQWRADNQVLRDHHRAAGDAAGSGLGARELEERDQPRAQDDPPPTPGTPQPPERMTRAELEHEFTTSDAALRAAIPGLDRLGVPSYRGPKVDEDGIVQSGPRGW